MEVGLFEDALGERAGVSGVTVHLYETGMTEPGERLAAIAEATGRPGSWFTGEEVEEPAPEPQPDPEPQPEPPQPEADLPSPEHADAPPPTVRLRARDLGGNALGVDTPDGGHVRVVASRDPETGQYISIYEVMTATTWEGKPVFVWEPVQTYRPCERATVEECLEAALTEIEAGPRAPEPEQSEPEQLERAIVPEELPQVPVSRRKHRRGLLGFLRR